MAAGIDAHGCQTYLQAAARRHGFAGIDHQVDEHLLHLHRIGAYHALVGAKKGSQLDVLTDEPPEHALRLRYHLVHVHQARLHHLAPRECQELSGQRGGSGRAL